MKAGVRIGLDQFYFRGLCCCRYKRARFGNFLRCDLFIDGSGLESPMRVKAKTVQGGSGQAKLPFAKQLSCMLFTVPGKPPASQHCDAECGYGCLPPDAMRQMWQRFASEQVELLRLRPYPANPDMARNARCSVCTTAICTPCFFCDKVGDVR